MGLNEEKAKGHWSSKKSLRLILFLNNQNNPHLTGLLSSHLSAITNLWYYPERLMSFISLRILQSSAFVRPIV